MTGEMAAGDGSAGGTGPELRASHADRDHAVEILRVAAGDGRLTSDELDQRLEAALTARTYRELTALTADLPAAPGPAGAVPAQPKELVKIHCMGSNAERAGSWVVPREMQISNVGGGVKLDFTQAVITQPTLRIEANVKGGRLLLITRPGIEVNAEDVSLVGGSVKVRPPGGSQQPVILRIEISGHNFGGNIVVRERGQGAGRRPRRSLRQWLLRRG
jgi:Domain of unknown function (DUF1707)